MAIVGWILLSLLLLIVIILILPIGIRIEYLQTWKIKIKLFGVIPVYSLSGDQPPKTPKPTPAVQPPPDDRKKDEPSLKEQFKTFYKEEGIKGVFTLLKALTGIAKSALSRVAHSMMINRLQLYVRVGGEEAHAVAKRYGQLCAALFPTVTLLSSSIRMRKPLVRVDPDFLHDGTDVRVRMTVYILPIGVVWAGLAALIKLIGVWSGVTKTVQNATDNTNTDESQKT